MQILIPLLAIMAVIFWRDVLKILVMVVAVLFIILIAFGAVGLLEGMHHLAR